jgi:chromosome segregation ATPase
MSDELTQIREHLARHDERFDALESKVENEAGLRAMTDRDQTLLAEKIASNTKLVQAVAATQGDHSRMLTRLEGRVMRVEDRLENVEGHLANVDGRLTNVEGHLANVEGRLGNVEGRLGNVEGRLGNVEGQLGNVETGIRMIVDKLDLALRPRRAFWRRSA